jgi:hypothetical protein
VRARQDAVRELAADLDLRERVAIMGDELRLAVHAGLLRRWSATPIRLRGTGIRFALALLAAGTANALVWWMTTGNGVVVLVAVAIAQMAVAAAFKRAVSEVIEAVDEPATISSCSPSCSQSSSAAVVSPCLKQLQARIGSTGRRRRRRSGRCRDWWPCCRRGTT